MIEDGRVVHGLDTPDVVPEELHNDEVGDVEIVQAEDFLGVASEKEVEIAGVTLSGIDW